jgi:hypothetical protein
VANLVEYLFLLESTGDKWSSLTFSAFIISLTGLRALHKLTSHGISLGAHQQMTGQRKCGIRYTMEYFCFAFSLRLGLAMQPRLTLDSGLCLSKCWNYRHVPTCLAHNGVLCIHKV